MAKRKKEQEGSEPFYQRIAEDLRNRILGGELAPQTQLPSENELRGIYRVSRVTVRGALKKLQTEGLVRRVNGKGTFVSFLPEKQRRIILVVESYPGKTRHLHELILGSLVEAQNEGFSVLVLPYEQLRGHLEDAVARPVVQTGVLLLRCRNFAPADIRYAEKHGIPCLLEGSRRLKGYNWLAVDNEDAMRRIIDHLYQSGRRSFGILNSEAPYSWSPFKERYAAARARLKELGVHGDSLQTMTLKANSDGDNPAYALTAGFFKKGNRPDAIVCVNDVIAVQSMRWLFDHGFKVPEDVAVTGFDDILLARYSTPSLTTVRQSYYEVGGEAVRSLSRMLDDFDNKRMQVTRKLELVIRESTAGVRSGVDGANP